MFKPRNSFVTARLLEKKDQQVGGVTIPGVNNPLYTEAEIISVGPGSETMPGSKTEMHDLKTGQRVYIKHKKAGRGPGLFADEGMQFIEKGEILWVFEQSSVLAILAEPGDAPASSPQLAEPEAKPGPKLVLN